MCYQHRSKLISTPWFQFIDACLDLTKDSPVLVNVQCVVENMFLELSCQVCVR